ncbi:MAG: hypothetical protein DLM72_12425 [Candidatus Nitrosopolaris wilkensis]|nr:MAG: hypothetical protein DLM72_12425 [Candidatus Nitrosopolaris wilkensis]
MISSTNNRRDTKKDYRLCVRCKSPVFDILRSSEKHDSIVTVDLNHKRHICTGPGRIIREENIVKGLQRHIEKINELELSSFQLGLAMEEGAGT